MKVIFLINWYNEKNESRKKELLDCLEKVQSDKDIDVVLCLKESEQNDTAVIFHSERTVVYNINHRPTYNDFFQIANKYTEEGDIVIFGNTDIYPEEGAIELCKDIKPNECYALARWDVDANGNKTLLDRWDTADIWVFKAPIKPNIQGDFYLGQAGCDNAIADRIMQAGYKVLNPSRTIKFNHLHLSGVINYSDRDRIKKPYLLITPHNLGEEPSYNHVL